MKLSVLVPSDEYKSYAGTRIRYQRIEPALRARGVNLSVEAIASFDPLAADCDVLLISKCHDARSLIIAAVLTDRGRLVGPDLFDDYFSDPTDSRLLSHRAWLTQLAGISRFAVCSTSLMAEVVRTFGSQLPVHVMNDPGPGFDLQTCGALLARKLDYLLERSVLKASWYGVGDNPYFPVGLEDLFAFASLLHELQRSPIKVKLTILTNERSLSARGLSLIDRLPVAAEVREWTEGAERELLAESFLSFLPVNAQPFSRAKSLNRAVTSLSSGCQVLSAGYPLYEPLNRFIYRDPQKLLRDIQSRRLRLSLPHLADYAETVAAVASSENEADRLVDFLSGLVPNKASGPKPIRLIHGSTTREESHRLIQSIGGISIASPYTSADLDYDVIFRGSPSAMEMLVSSKATAQLQESVKAELGRRERHRGRMYLRLHRLRSPLPPRRDPQVEWFNRSDAFKLATYRMTMERISLELNRAFTPGRLFISEHSRLPVSASFEAA